MKQIGLQQHYIRLYNIVINLTENIHQFINVLVLQISQDLAVDRLGIFLAVHSGARPKYILRGIYGPRQENDRLDYEVKLKCQFDQSDIYFTPTSGLGWDAYIAVRDELKNVVAVLAIDDTKIARKFTEDQKVVIFHIRMVLEMLLRQRRIIDEFRFLDPLTGLLNRRGLKWKIEEIVNFRKRNKDTFYSLAFLDLDNFKKINSNFGEPFGDLFLKKFTQVLKAKMRASDIIARYGGEEFVIIWNNQADVLASKLNKLLKEFAKLEITDGEKKTIGIAYSGGVTDIQEYETPNTALKRANEMMRYVKESGKSRVLVR